MENTTTALTLPDEDKFRNDIQAINRFQQIVRATMVSGQDYGVIPGTSKPTLLKPGAEKIAKLLGLCDQYEIIDRQENWDKGFFRYLIKCRLVTLGGVTITEGLGECNSMESRYHWRWVFQSQLPEYLQGDTGKVDRDKLVSREITTRNGRAKQYRVENDDIYSQVNTLLKMAKKRALVDAALSAGRLSEVFTQDVEDIENLEPEPPTEPKKPAVKPKQTEPAEHNPADIDMPEPKELKTIGQFFTACNQRWGLTPSEVEAKLGKPKSQFVDLREEWITIKKAVEG